MRRPAAAASTAWRWRCCADWRGRTWGTCPLKLGRRPYRGGGGPAVAGLMGGETQVMFATAASAMPAVRGGKAKALGVTGTKRLEQVPAAGTMVEQGFPDLTASS